MPNSALAEDLGAFGRLRVIKEMLDYSDTSDSTEVQKAKRFENEARTLACGERCWGWWG